MLLFSKALFRFYNGIDLISMIITSNTFLTTSNIRQRTLINCLITANGTCKRRFITLWLIYNSCFQLSITLKAYSH